MSYGNDNDLVNMAVTAIAAILLLTILTIITPSINKYLPTPLSSVAHSLEYYEGLGWGLITMILFKLFITCNTLFKINFTILHIEYYEINILIKNNKLRLLINF